MLRLKITKNNFHFYVRKKVDYYILLYTTKLEGEEIVHEKIFSTDKKLEYFLDENEFISDYDIKSVSYYYLNCPKCKKEIKLEKDKDILKCEKCGKKIKNEVKIE